MLLALITLPVVAILALAMLSALWVLTTNREMGRLRRRKTLRLAARLRSELLKELVRLEARNEALRVRVASGGGLRRAGPSRTIIGPELIEDLHASMITDLRQRADHAYLGIQFERGTHLDSRCEMLEAITREVGILAKEIEERERALGSLAAPRLRSAQPEFRLVRTA